MSNVQVSNRINQLVVALEKVIDKQSRRDVASEAATRAGPTVLGAFRKAAPKGRVEPSFQIGRRMVSHGRPSLRLHGTTLEQAWAPPNIIERDIGVEVQMLSDAPHMQILLDGAGAHPIPKSPPRLMTFWWFREGHGTSATYLSSGHPGFKSKAGFIDTAMDSGGRAEFEQRLSEAIPGLFGPLRRVLPHGNG